MLEALNRLLDDHRELYLAETNETVRAHPDFAVFATQNPAGGAYGGRKVPADSTGAIFRGEAGSNNLAALLGL